MITVNDEDMEWSEDMTISDMLDRIENTDYCAAIRLNGRLVSSPDFDKTIIPDQSIIYILPPVAGG